MVEHGLKQDLSRAAQKLHIASAWLLLSKTKEFWLDPQVEVPLAGGGHGPAELQVC